MNRSPVLALAVLVCAIILAPCLAQAQSGGGGLDSVVSWGVATFGRPLLNVAVVMFFITLMLMRASVAMLAFVAIGGFGLVNYQLVTGLLGF